MNTPLLPLCESALDVSSCHIKAPTEKSDNTHYIVCSEASDTKTSRAFYPSIHRSLAPLNTFSCDSIGLENKGAHLVT